MKNESNPYFSVIIPCYNVVDTLPPTFECLVKQSYKNFEVVFINDGSNDGTKELIENFKLDQDIIVINQKNYGLGSARNSGIKASKGKFLALLDADDLWEENKLEMVYNYLMKNNSRVICHNELVVNEKNKLLKKNYYGPHTTYEDLLFKNNCLSPSAVVIERDVFNEVGYFTENLKLHGVEDYDMWLRIAFLNIKISYMPDFLGSYVIHGNNMSVKYNFFDRIEALYIKQVENINLDSWDKRLRYTFRLLKFYIIKLKTAALKMYLVEVLKILKDIFYLIVFFKKYISMKEKI